MQSSNSVIVEVWEAIDGDGTTYEQLGDSYIFFILYSFFTKEILEEI